MAWQSKVPLWVLNLAAQFLIPDEAGLTTGIKLASLEEDTDEQSFTLQTGQGNYPGVIPNYSIVPESDITTEGVDWKIQFRKAVGFYGVKTEIFAYDSTKLNQWNFPLDRKQFGFMTVSRNDAVLVSEPISYAQQFFIGDGILSILSGYNDQFGITKLFNKADDFVANLFSFYVNPTCQLRVTFLPVWEVWQLAWFSESE